MQIASFKDRVVAVAVQQAPIYKRVFVDYDYIVCSDAFRDKPYYVISARADNYRHLIGVSTELSAKDFFDACMNNTLTADDISFIKKNRSEKEVKGSVRKKINVLPRLMTIFENEMVVQEHFVKNRVSCAFATTDCILTTGFVDTGCCRPMTLLDGDELDWSHAADIDIILRRPHGTQKFTEIVHGEPAMLAKHIEAIELILDDDLRKTQLRIAGKENVQKSNIQGITLSE